MTSQALDSAAIALWLTYLFYIIERSPVRLSIELNEDDRWNQVFIVRLSKKNPLLTMFIFII